MSEEKLSVKKRIVKIANLLRVKKEGENKFANYSYFQPDVILANLNPLLEENNLFTKFQLKIHPTKENYYVGELTIEDVDSEEGKQVYEFDIEKAEVKGANAAQNSGATLTYGKRYSLMNAFNIADNDDDFDSNKMTKLQKKGTNNAQNKNIKKSTKDRVNDMVSVFKKEFDVSKEQIEKFIGKKVENINDAELSKLSVVYSNIKADKNKKEEYFK
jgi:flagellar motility protein MotE (MotC chaperone)